jgi:tetratricopeptide (TPR) repeat protein
MPLEPELQRPDFLELWDFRDPSASEARFRALLDTTDAQADPSRAAQLLSQIARTHGLRRDFDGAHAILDDAEDRLAGHDLPVARLRCRLERGRAFDSPAHALSDKQTDAARACYLEVFEEGQRLGLHGLALDAAHMLGIIEPPEAALSWNLRAIALAEASEDEASRKWLGSLYNNTGWTYHDRGEFEAALGLFEKARAFREAAGPSEPLRIARWCVARCLRSLGRVTEALDMQRALIDEYEAGEDPEVGYASEEMAECLLALGRTDAARPWFARANARLREQESWLLEAEPERMARLERLGER